MIRVREIKIPITKDTKDNIILECAKKMKINEKDIISYNINKKSIDARKTKFILYL